jgi:hypothetical protein
MPAPAEKASTKAPGKGAGIHLTGAVRARRNPAAPGSIVL